MQDELKRTVDELAQRVKEIDKLSEDLTAKGQHLFGTELDLTITKDELANAQKQLADTQQALTEREQELFGVNLDLVSRQEQLDSRYSCEYNGHPAVVACLPLTC